MALSPQANANQTFTQLPTATQLSAPNVRTALRRAAADMALNNPLLLLQLHRNRPTDREGKDDSIHAAVEQADDNSDRNWDRTFLEFEQVVGMRNP